MRKVRRPPKRQRHQDPPEFSDDDDSSVDPDPPPPPRKPRPIKVNGWQMRIGAEVGPGIELSNEEIERRLSFCCHVCHCSKEDCESFGDDEYVVADTRSLWHRRCCHNLRQAIGTDWLPPFEEACSKAEQMLYIESPALRLVTADDVWKKYKSAFKPQESEYYNDDGMEGEADRLRTNEEYRKNELWFHKESTKALLERSKGIKQKLAVVVDAFGGIGSLIVCLKRLGIAMKKVIHIEHDKIANHVFKHMHDPSYNKDLPEDGIEYVYYETFEEFETNIDSIMEEHGPFDIITGGPPCVDYTGVNANGQGVDGKQGQYMLLFGKLICYINRKQIAQCYPPVKFLAENAVIRDDMDLPLEHGDLGTVREAFQVEWDLMFDARSVSPLRRKRTYISNIPLQLGDKILFDPPPKTCLEDGFDVPGRIFEPEMVAKTQGLMASLSRIDDDRMNVYRARRRPKKKNPAYYEQRTLMTIERERLMGFKEGYVSKPVEFLFQNLVENGLAKGQRAEINNWKNAIDPKYLTFCGDYHHFEGKHGNPFRFVENAYPVKLRLAPPLATRKPSFFSADDYCKRLLGNGFSIPTVEILLRPLVDLFGSKVYTNYNYDFAWDAWKRDSANNQVARMPMPAPDARRRSHHSSFAASSSSSDSEDDEVSIENRKSADTPPLSEAEPCVVPRSETTVHEEYDI